MSYRAMYYDLADRPTATVDVGTNAGTAYTRPSSVPSRSDTVLVTSQTFDAAGRVYEVTDPRGLVARNTHDALGRTTKTVENYVDGTVGDDNDKTTEYAYGPAGMTSLTAKLTGGGVQTTQWVYGVTSAGGSGVDSNDIVGETRWPDPSTGAASSTEKDTVKVNALGQLVNSTDRNGNVHALTYDVLGRIAADAVTTLGTNVDGSVRRVETAYDGQGNPYLFTNYDAASSGNVVNQVKREFNGLGQLTTEWQEHAGSVTGSSLRVQYAYSEMAGGANHSRLTSMTYPNGKVLTWNYSSGLNSDISRLSSLSDTSGTLESYDYLGVGTVVRRAHSQPGVDLTYIKQTGEGDGDAGDKYAGLDRFGRVVDQRWIVASTGVATDRFQYGYDRNSNRLWRDNLVNTAFGEVYAYDNLNQVTSFKRGTLNSGKTDVTGTPSRQQSWDYDAVGNWDSVTTDSSTQTRSANKQNEVTGISGATTPIYDANGNMTGDEAGKQFVYDAWNRLVKAKDSGGNTLVTYSYDGLGRRVRETASGTTTDLYYSAAWQVIEERVGGAVRVQNVWSPVYVDALVLRDRDADGNEGLEERLWVQQDANWNTTALVNTSGSVVERYAYDPFGTATVLDHNWTADADGVSDNGWVNLHQGLRRDITSGTDDNRRRTNHYRIGRFGQNDSGGYAMGDINLYRYEGNSPLANVDPTGNIVKQTTVTPTGSSVTAWFDNFSRPLILRIQHMLLDISDALSRATDDIDKLLNEIDQSQGKLCGPCIDKSKLSRKAAQTLDRMEEFFACTKSKPCLSYQQIHEANRVLHKVNQKILSQKLTFHYVLPKDNNVGFPAWADINGNNVSIGAASFFTMAISDQLAVLFHELTHAAAGTKDYGYRVTGLSGPRDQSYYVDPNKPNDINARVYLSTEQCLNNASTYDAFLAKYYLQSTNIDNYLSGRWVY